MRDNLVKTIKERVVPGVKNFALGAGPGMLIGGYLGKKYIPTYKGNNKLLQKFGPAALGSNIGGAIGGSINRAVSLNNKFKKELDRKPTVGETTKSVGASLTPFVGGSIMTPESMVEKIKKQASDENSVNKEGKIPAIENALSCPIAREVATMMATSHEYKTPNVDGALAMVKNYKWEKDTAKLSSLQGIDKPIKKEKVLAIAEGIKENKGKVSPFIVVNQLHGIRPQTPGKKILLDGHHRMEACEFLGKEEIPVYKGTYTGAAQKSKEELRSMDKIAMYREEIYKEAKEEENKWNPATGYGKGVASKIKDKLKGINAAQKGALIGSGLGVATAIGSKRGGVPLGHSIGAGALIGVPSAIVGGLVGGGYDMYRDSKERHKAYMNSLNKQAHESIKEEIYK